jgi:hypothetical protein
MFFALKTMGISTTAYNSCPLNGYSAVLSIDFQILENKFQQGDIAGIALTPTGQT